MDEYAILYVPSASRVAAQDWAEAEFGNAAQRNMFAGIRVSASGSAPATGWLSHIQTNAQRRSRLSTFITIPNVRWARVDIDTGAYRGGNTGGTVGQAFSVADFLAFVGVSIIQPVR